MLLTIKPRVHVRSSENYNFAVDIVRELWRGTYEDFHKFGQLFAPNLGSTMDERGSKALPEGIARKHP